MTAPRPRPRPLTHIYIVPPPSNPAHYDEHDPRL